MTVPGTASTWRGAHRQRALTVTTSGVSATFATTELACPPPDAGRVEIAVAAAGLGFPDALVVQGLYQEKPGLPFVPGMEVAGTVRSAPRGSGLTPGQRVVAVTGAWGACQEVVTVDAERVYPAPAGLTWAEAAVATVNPHTAYYALVRRGRFESGETVLVAGASGGLGDAVVQIALALGARVIALSRRPTPSHLLGRPRLTWVTGTTTWTERVTELAPRGAHLIVDPVGGDQARDLLRLLAPEGRLVTTGFASGVIPSVAFNRLLLRNISVVGAAWREFVTVTEPSYGRAVADCLAPLFGDGDVTVPVTPCPLDDAPDRLTELVAGTRSGRVAVMLGSPR